MADLIVVGAGLTGLYASALAASRGADVILVSRGRGGLSFSHGCIDVWPRATDLDPAGADDHTNPYALAGRQALQRAAHVLLAIAGESDLEYVGAPDTQLTTLTPLGALRPTQLAPASSVVTLDTFTLRTAIAGVIGFRDFDPALTRRGLRSQGIEIAPPRMLPMPTNHERRDAYATDLAAWLDATSVIPDLARLWRPHLSGIKTLGLPAILGLTHPGQVVAQLEEALGLAVFEIPTLPPSVPGIRLEMALREHALRSGVTYVEGPSAIGRVDGRDTPRAVGVVADAHGAQRVFHGTNTLLATGGVLHGGLVSLPDGQVQEAVFDLPVTHTPGREAWLTARPGDSQPYAGFGVRVNARMQPLGADGEPVVANLYAAGGLIAGPDRTLGGCRQGIDLATAHKAVEVILG